MSPPSERCELRLGGAPRHALIPNRGIVELEPAYSLAREFDWYEVSSFRDEDFQQHAWVLHVVTTPDTVSEAWEAPRIALTPPHPDQFGQMDDYLCGGLSERVEHAIWRNDNPYATPVSTAFKVADAQLLDDAAIGWAWQLVCTVAAGRIELTSRLDVHWASRLLESSPTNDYEPHVSDWTWRVGFAATFGRRKVLAFVEAELREIDSSWATPHEGLAKALRAERVDTTRVGVIFPRPDGSASIDAEPTDVLWLADQATIAKSPDEVALAAVLQLLDEPAIDRLRRRHRLPDGTRARDILFSLYRTRPTEIITAMPQKDLIWALLCPIEVSPGRYEAASRPDQMSRLELNEEAQRLWFRVNYSAGPNIVESTPEAVREMITKRQRAS
jgi:hypothetical protein